MAIERIALLGCGLIGGSFALGLKQHGFKGEIVGWDKQEVLAQAHQRGAIDRGTTELNDAVAAADLTYLATPVTVILELLPAVAAAAKPGALLTDAGSTKVRICRLAQQVVPEGVTFLGGHPGAGKEVGGIENASADLFAGAKYMLVKDAEEAEEEDETVKEFIEWLGKLGAEPVWLDAETHDWAMAMVSHLPQLVSTALAATVWDETDEDGLPLSLAGAGFRDMTRLAASPYDIWRDICLTNGENLERALDRLSQALERIRTHLRSKELEAEFQRAQQAVALLQSRRRRSGNE
jgi:prephenate dehydrogenase